MKNPDFHLAKYQRQLCIRVQKTFFQLFDQKLELKTRAITPQWQLTNSFFSCYLVVNLYDLMLIIFAQK
jgi:hypothetical protein